MLLIVPIAVITGASVALFLWLMELAQNLRWNNLWLITGLPAAGILIAWMYKTAGGNLAAGNDLLIEEIHVPKNGVSKWLAPLIFITTLITHVFGGSAGREGTAVQMGGGIAGAFLHRFRPDKHQISVLLSCGMAAGFGAVFGTPFAGALFAIEVLTRGRLKYRISGPCLFAALIAHGTVMLTGAQHTTYQVLFVPGSDGVFRWLPGEISLAGKVLAAGVIFGCTSRLYVLVSDNVRSGATRLVSSPVLRPAIGGLLIILIGLVPGNLDYLGLGVSNPNPGGVSILSAFKPGGAETFSWFWKLLLTAITLGFGFKGGEVTPLFFIGATLANIIAVPLAAPVDLLAAAGFLAVFAGATKTPVACTVMGIELFGIDNFIFFAIACFVSSFCSGKNGIYAAQRKG